MIVAAYLRIVTLALFCFVAHPLSPSFSLRVRTVLSTGFPLPGSDTSPAGGEFFFCALTFCTGVQPKVVVEEQIEAAALSGHSSAACFQYLYNSLVISPRGSVCLFHSQRMGSNTLEPV